MLFIAYVLLLVQDSLATLANLRMMFFVHVAQCSNERRPHVRLPCVTLHAAQLRELKACELQHMHSCGTHLGRIIVVHAHKHRTFLKGVPRSMKMRTRSIM